METNIESLIDYCVINNLKLVFLCGSSVHAYQPHKKECVLNEINYLTKGWVIRSVKTRDDDRIVVSMKRSKNDIQK